MSKKPAKEDAVSDAGTKCSPRKKAEETDLGFDWHVNPS
jgi:hypothetical protein